jgi:hypothetical protein
MKSWRPSRPSPAMIVALLSLCVALGGSAIAATSSGGPATSAAKKKKLAPKNSVNSAAVINNSLKLGDFKKSERAKLKGNKGDQGIQGIQGPPGTPDGYTKTEADGKFLGKTEKAADSEKLDGKDSSDYIQGEGSQLAQFRIFGDNTGDNDFIALPGIGRIEIDCANPMHIRFRNTSADNVQWERVQNGAGPNSAETGPGAFFDFNLGTTDTQLVLQLHRLHSIGLGISNQDNVTLFITMFRSAVGDPLNSCRVHAQAIHNHASSSGLIIGP